MFNPLVSAVGFGAAAGKPVIDISHGVVTSYVDAVTMPLKYQINQTQLTLLPSPADAYEAYVNRYLNQEGWDWLCKFNNIPTSKDRKDQFQSFGSKIWSTVFDAKVPQLPIDQIIVAGISGVCTKETANDLLKLYGFRQTQIQLLKDILEPKFDTTVVIGNYLRGYTNRTESIAAIRKLYGCSENQASNIIQLSSFIPPVQDIIRFAVRDVFNPDLVRDLQLDAEYDQNTDFQTWAKAQGIGNAIIFDDDGQPVVMDVPRKYWQAHWVLPSPSQLYTFLHRLREDRIASIKDQFPDVTAFSTTDLDTFLKANDYVPKVRRWLEAVSFNPIGRIDLRRGFNEDVIKDNEVLEQIKDQGYNNRDANILFDVMRKMKDEYKKAKEKREGNDLYGKWRMQLLLAYEEGSIRRDTVANMLLTTDWDADRVFKELDAIDIKVNRKIVAEYIKQTRAEFFLGGMDGIKAYEILIDGGVSSDRANKLVQLWQRQQTRKRKTASTEQLIKWYEHGFIPLNDLRDRLSTLGWQGSDVILLMTEGEERFRTRVAKAELALARSNKQQVDAIRRLEKEMEREAKAQVSRLAAVETPTRLKEWYLLNLITIDEIMAKLQRFGWPQDDILRFAVQLETLKGGKDGQSKT